MNDAFGVKNAGYDDFGPEKLPFSDKGRRLTALRGMVELRLFSTMSYEIECQVLKQTNHVLYLAARRRWPVIKLSTSTAE
jgi:hypothetical protein